MIKIRELREENGLKQKDLAEKIGVVAHNVGDWERGKCEPSIEILVKLANFFGVSVDYIIGNSDDFGVINTQNNLTKGEQRLLNAFSKSDEILKDKLIELAEFYSSLSVLKK